MSKERIQKLLAEAGVASRRGAEELVVQGRVTVNGRLVVKLPCFVDARADEVRVDGQRVRLREVRHVYLLVNKPPGTSCAFGERGRHPSVYELVRPGPSRLHCVGPLNVSDAGLILLTDDGQLAQRIRHPRCRLASTYFVELDGALEARWVESLRQGLRVGRWRADPATVRLLSRNPQRTAMEVSLAEARNGELRRILARTGHRVRRMKRLALGGLADKALRPGAVRPLRPAEIDRLMRAAQES